MTAIQTLKLQNFRCYDQAALQDLQTGLIVLSGPNGAGKTNILEAISLLSPGRGLRSAGVMEIQKNSAPSAWAVSGTLHSAYEEIKLGTGLDPASKPNAEKRTVRINGQTERSQSAFAKYLSCVWLTPQMDRLFLDSSRDRRKFLDRLVFAFDASHAGRVTRYENALGQRSRLLKDGKNDNAWLSGLEQQMAETGVAIAAARLECVHRLQTACNNAEHAYFPLARLAVKGTIEELLAHTPALEVEELFKYQLRSSRTRDSHAGGAATGPHKTDLQVIYAAKNMHADQCSTGEQKALLIGIILAHARLLKAERGRTPILLLDEVAAHLDENRRRALYDILNDLGAQGWLTGTDDNLFDAIKSSAQFFTVRNSSIFGNNTANEMLRAKLG
jgi:DNA replication and repair protein RecF